MKFRAVIRLSGKTATGVEVPAEVVAGLGPSKRPAVCATVAGYVYRSSVGSMGGKFMLPISAEVRANAGVAAGDEVEVDLQLDDQPREVTLPVDLADALSKDPDARSFFESMSYSHRRWYVLPLEGSKTEATRQRRLEKALSMLREGRLPG